MNGFVNITEMIRASQIGVRVKLDGISFRNIFYFIFICVYRCIISSERSNKSIIIKFFLTIQERVIFRGEGAKEITPTFLFFFCYGIYYFIAESINNVFEGVISGIWIKPSYVITLFKVIMNIIRKSKGVLIFNMVVSSLIFSITN